MGGAGHGDLVNGTCRGSGLSKICLKLILLAPSMIIGRIPPPPKKKNMINCTFHWKTDPILWAPTSCG